MPLSENHIFQTIDYPPVPSFLTEQDPGTNLWQDDRFYGDNSLSSNFENPYDWTGVAGYDVYVLYCANTGQPASPAGYADLLAAFGGDVEALKTAIAPYALRAAPITFEGRWNVTNQATHLLDANLYDFNTLSVTANALGTFWEVKDANATFSEITTIPLTAADLILTYADGILTLNGDAVDVSSVAGIGITVLQFWGRNSDAPDMLGLRRTEFMFSYDDNPFDAEPAVSISGTRYGLSSSSHGFGISPRKARG